MGNPVRIGSVTLAKRKEPRYAVVHSAASICTAVSPRPLMHVLPAGGSMGKEGRQGREGERQGRPQADVG